MRDYLRIVLDESGIMPERAHETDAGLDLFAPKDFVVPAHGYAFTSTGVHVELPYGTDGHIRSKSGLNRDHGLTADGTVDEGYTGDIGIVVHNDGDEDYRFSRGDKVAQLVIEEIRRPTPIRVSRIEGGPRGDDGYGSTGR